MDYAYHAHLTLERLLPRLERRFAEAAQAHPADWQAFLTRLRAHFGRLFELTVRIYGSQYDYYYHLEELLAGMAQSWLAGAHPLYRREVWGWLLYRSFLSTFRRYPRSG